LVTIRLTGVERPDTEKQCMQSSIAVRKHVSCASMSSRLSPEFPEEVTQICERREEVSIVDSFWIPIELQHKRRIRKRDRRRIEVNNLVRRILTKALLSGCEREEVLFNRGSDGETIEGLYGKRVVSICIRPRETRSRSSKAQ